MDFKLNIDYSVLLECGVSPELILNGETTSYNVNVTGMTEDVNTVEVYDENVNTPVNLEEENYCLEDAVRNCFCGDLTPHSVEIEEKELLNNNNIIKNISFDQSEILYNIMKLYNNGEPFECDITASELKFYEGRGRSAAYNIPLPKLLFDVYPQDERVKKITPFERLPLPDNSLSSIICDLPFVISPHKCPSLINNVEGSNLISKRFSSFYPAEELFENIYWWIKECFRVLKSDGILIWKMQSTVSGGRQVWASPFSFLCATSIGFYVVDEFILEAKARLIASSKIKTQQHSRKYTSNFFVFKKGDKRAKKNNILNILKDCEQNVYEGKKWEVK